MATKAGKAGLDIEFVAETNSLAVFWKSGPADHGEEVRPGVVIDYDVHGRAIGVEFMGGAREFIAELGARAGLAT